MQPLVEELEPEMEELLLRLVPELAEQWKGATEDEIERIEQLAGRPLPRFYRWFLMRMGQSMGPVAYPTLDLTAPKVLECYAEGLLIPHPRFLMIGFQSDLMSPLHLQYDFDYPLLDDARVIKRHAMGGAAHNQYDTLREMIAWGEVLTRRVETQPQQCRGLLVDSGLDVLSHLQPVMASLGFTEPIQTGSCCAMYESEHSAMVTGAEPGEEPEIHVFHLGGSDAGRLRRILGEIATETQLKVEITEWNPPLA